MTHTLYRYRWLLYELVIRDLVLRYRGSVLGFVWTLLNPVLFMLVYTLVFSVYLRIGIEHYAVFLVAGLVPWQWFANSMLAGTSSIVDGRMYVGKAVFEPAILVIVPICSNFVNFLLSLPLVIIVAWVLHVQISWAIVMLPVLIGIQFLFTLALLLLIAPFNVFFRDLQQLITILLMVVFYLSPVFYPIMSIPQSFRAVVLANPMVPLLLAYQDIFYYNRVPHAMPIAYSLAASAVLFFVGRAVFNRYKDALADYL